MEESAINIHYHRLSMRMLRPLLILSFILLLFAAGCGSDSDEKSASSTDSSATTTEDTTTEDTTEAASTGCTKATLAEPKTVKLAKPTTKLDKNKTYIAKVETNCGTFEIKLDSKRAPKTGGSFAYLAKKKFYDGLSFHRIIPGFVVQGGDPQGSGQGGSGYKVVETPPTNLKYTEGVVAMAKAPTERAGTSGSQFFVVTGGDASQLPPEYALLGKVTKGMDVVTKIAVVPTDQADAPVDPVVMKKVTIQEK